MQQFRTHPGITALKESRKYSDLLLKCGDREFPVHRAIVCPQSEFFSKTCDGPFREAHNAVIELHDDDPKHVALMVEYFYNFDYDDILAVLDPAVNPAEASPGAFVNMLRVFKSAQGDGDDEAKDRAVDLALSAAVADPSRNYTFAGLEQVQDMAEAEIAAYTRARNELLDAVSDAVRQSQLDNVAVYALGEKYIIPEMKKLAVEKFKAWRTSEWGKHLPEIMREVYGTTPQSDRGLRDVVVDVCVDQLDKPTRKSFRTETFEQTVKDIPDARMDILDATVAKQNKEISKLQEMLAESKSDLDTALSQLAWSRFEKAQCERTAAEAESTRTKVWQTVIEKMNTLDECRHCRADFKLVFDAAESKYESGKIVTRCEDCRTRH